MNFSGCWKAFNTSELSSRMLFVVSTFERAMLRLNEPARRNLLWGSITAILGLKARTPYVTSTYILQRVLFIESTFDDIRHDPTMDFQDRFSQDAASQQLPSCSLIEANHYLFERTTTSNIRLLNSEVLKAFEHPLKFMLMLLGIVVENSKQYGSKWHKLFFQTVWKSPESVLLGRATRHSIRNVSNFLTHIHMSSYEDACILYLRIHRPPP